MDFTHFKQMNVRCILDLRQNFFDVVILLLALFQPTKCAYRIVSMRDACSLGHSIRHELRLSASGYNSAASIIFDTKHREFEPGLCGIDLVAAPTHVIALHLAAATPTPSTEASQEDVTRYRPPCPLSLYSAGKTGKLNRLLQSVDLCSGDVATLTELYSRHHVAIIWSPPHRNVSANIQASELVVTSVGVGPTLCKKNANTVHTYFPCRHQNGRPAPYCVATELLCDGRRNCPVGGEDEDDELCGDHLPLMELPVDGQNNTVRRNRQNKMVAVSDDNHKMAVSSADSVELFRVRDFVMGNRTRNSTNSLIGKKNSKRNRATFPEALAHYGPWGYLMLGMLISGTVLMICGVWECCCRDHKLNRSASSSTPTPTPMPPPNDVFVIMPTTRAEESTSPPAYDDLDQPPAYNVLFPSPCKLEVTGAQEEREDGADVSTNS